MISGNLLTFVFYVHRLHCLQISTTEGDAMDAGTLTNEGLIELHLDGVTQSEILAQMISLLFKQNRIASESEFSKGVLERESECTTGFGNGFAIPHCKSDTVKQASIVVAKCRNDIEWDALDGEPVKYVIMLAIPKSQGGTTHLEILGMLSRKLMDDDFRDAFIAATQKHQILDLLAESGE